MTRLVCVGDLHLGSGPELAETPAARLADQEAVLAQVVDAANELDAPLLWVGDAFEKPRPKPAEILAFRRQIERLRIGAVLIPGNHDREGNQPTALELIGRAPDKPTTRALYYLDRPTVFPLAWGVTVCALPWTTVANLVASEGGGDRDDLVRRLGEGLVDVARGLFLEAQTQSSKAQPIVLAAHWSVAGAETASGMPTDLMREPVLDRGELEAIGFDAIVLGHIHKPQLLGPSTFYVGSPLALNFGEPGDHVAWLLELNGGAMMPFQIPLDSPALVTLDANAVDLEDGKTDVYVEEVPAGAIVKLRIRADEEQAARIDVAGVRRDLIARGVRKVWSVEILTDRAELVRGVAIDEDVDAVLALDLWLDAAEVDLGFHKPLHELHAGYLEGIRK